MGLVDKIKEAYKISGLDLTVLWMIAEKLGIASDAISQRHYQNLSSELASEIEKALPKGSEEELQAILNYLAAIKAMQPLSARKEKKP